MGIARRWRAGAIGVVVALGACSGSPSPSATTDLGAGLRAEVVALPAAPDHAPVAGLDLVRSGHALLWFASMSGNTDVLPAPSIELVARSTDDGRHWTWSRPRAFRSASETRTPDGVYRYDTADSDAGSYGDASASRLVLDDGSNLFVVATPVSSTGSAALDAPTPAPDVVMTSDHGTTWRRLALPARKGFVAVPLAAMRSGPRLILTGSLRSVGAVLRGGVNVADAAVWTSDDAGATWALQALDGPRAPLGAQGAVATSAIGDTLYAAGGDGYQPGASRSQCCRLRPYPMIWTSRDNGSTWKRASVDKPVAKAAPLFALAGAITQRGALLVAPFETTNPPGLVGELRSTDAGATWRATTPTSTHCLLCTGTDLGGGLQVRPTTQVEEVAYAYFVLTTDNWRHTTFKDVDLGCRHEGANTVLLARPLVTTGHVAAIGACGDGRNLEAIQVVVADRLVRHWRVVRVHGGAMDPGSQLMPAVAVASGILTVFVDGNGRPSSLIVTGR